MYKKSIAFLCGFLMLSVPALAQATCDAAKLSRIFDGYAAAPFSATNWRVLNGLGDPAIDPAFKGVNRSAEFDWEAQEAWKKLAGQIRPQSQSPRDIGYDCRITYPLQVLQTRIASLGIKSPYVRQWFSVQESVLQACSDPTAITALPEPMELDPPLVQMQKDDRAYQEASIAFYKDKPKAIALFRAIAATSSPHKAAARYNIANLLANAKNIAEARVEANAILADASLASVHGITQALLGYIANLEDTPAGWTSLIDDSVRAITSPKTAILSSAKNQDDYARALSDIDYVGIRAKNDDWWLNGVLPPNPTISKSILDASRKHPMVLWMIAGQTLQQKYDEAPWTLVGGKWLQYTIGYLDKVAAVSLGGPQISKLPMDVLNALRARPDDATRQDLWNKVHASLAAAQQSCGDAPETAALGTYISQAVRLSAATGHFDEAYDELSKLPFKNTSFYFNGILNKLSQYILGQGMAEEGRRLRDRLITPEFLASLPEDVKPMALDNISNFMSWVAEDETHWKQALSLHSDRTANPILNFLPIKTLWRLADDAAFSEKQKALLARVAWTRAYALGKTPGSAETAKLYSLNANLKTSAEKVAVDYPKLPSERQRLLTILRNPRLGILVNAPELWSPLDETGDNWTEVSSGDHNDRNWWCPLEVDRQLAGLRGDLGINAGIIEEIDYGYRYLGAVHDRALHDGLKAKMNDLLKQHPMIKIVNWKEISRLADMPGAPRKLSQSAITWAKTSKGDDGAAEALALAVRATHYGCNWHGRHGSYSRVAQELLKTKFPASKWAAETPYWFDCQRLEWDKDYNKKAVCDAKTWPKQALPK